MKSTVLGNESNLCFHREIEDDPLSLILYCKKLEDQFPYASHIYASQNAVVIYNALSASTIL